MMSIRLIGQWYFEKNKRTHYTTLHYTALLAVYRLQQRRNQPTLYLYLIPTQRGDGFDPVESPKLNFDEDSEKYV